MRWEEERYVRIYVRDTADWLALSFEAQCILPLVLRKLDRAGRMALGKHGKRAVAICLGHPDRWDVIGPALEELLADGCLVVEGDALVAPNFKAAQEATASPAKRCRDYRERHAETGEPTPPGGEPTRKVLGPTRKVSPATRDDTEQHAATRSDTPSRAVPCRAVPEKQQTLVPEAVASEDAPGFEALRATWNRVCAPVGFAKARASDGHKKAARVRLREPGWADAFKEACAYMAGEPFYRGGRDGKGFVADFGWLLKPGNSEKLADRAATKRPTGSTNERPEDAELRRALAAAERGDDSDAGAEDSEPDPGDRRDGPGIRGSPPFGPTPNGVAACAAPLSATLGAILGRGR